MKRAIQLTLPLLFLVTIFTAKANNESFWLETEKKKSIINVENAKYYNLDFSSLKKQLDQAPMENISQGFSSNFTIDIPLPDGSIEKFKIERTKLMEDELSAKYPEIKTFSGYSLKTNLRRITLDYTYKGFHAMISSPNEVVFIDPINLDTKNEYIVYYKSDFYNSNQSDFIEYGVKYPDDNEIILSTNTNQLNSPIGGELLTYRLAMATTGEYSSFHGGTSADVLSAVQTTVARVNSVYEVDLGVRLVLIANTDLLFHYNSSTDPYTNSSGGAMLGENQVEVDNVIGTANYDIGHVFSTGGGGIASYASVCSSVRKAQGVTGSFSPVGDPFDIDYVAHEIGHQFSGSHTFDGSGGSCGGNRSASTAYEPGSGSTIMAYAGICGGDNIQNNSDDFFHVGSFVEMTNFIYNGNGYSCAVSTPTSNNAPVVNANPTNSNYKIPINTPFELIGEATDPNGDSLTYIWEEYDKTSQSSSVNSPSNFSPIFRSWTPTTDGYHRVFPRISNLVNNNTVTGETLPFGTRNMEFRLTARDNIVGGGGVEFDNIMISVSDIAGPFRVNTPNTNVTWTSNSYHLVEWDIANTDAFPINCSEVDIFLSTDGGFTYPYTLLQNAPNDGNAIVLIPNITTSTARIKVKGAENIFFDISNTNFSIQNGIQNDYEILTDTDTVEICAPEDVELSYYFSNLGVFNEDLSVSISGIPAGGNSNLTKSTVNPNDTTTLSITNTGNIVSGIYDLELSSVGIGGTKTKNITLIVNNGAPEAPTAINPNTNFNGSTSPIFSWNKVDRAISYELEISENSDFSNFYWKEINITDTFLVLRKYLNESTDYFWRIRSMGTCENGEYSTPVSFSTSVPSCQTFSLDSSIETSFGLNSIDYTVSGTGTVSDINIKALRGEHTNIGDLKFSLVSPSSKEIVLINRFCSTNDDFNIRFDDQSIKTEIPCPYTDALTYQAQENLYDFNNEPVNGEWTLKIEDFLNPFNGTVLQYDLEVCSVDGTVNIRENKNININIYPNPAKDELFISSSVKLKSASISNMLGQKLQDININAKRVDISNLSDGIYFVTLQPVIGNPVTKRIIIK